MKTKTLSLTEQIKEIFLSSLKNDSGFDKNALDKIKSLGDKESLGSAEELILAIKKEEKT